MKPQVLVVDDEESIVAGLTALLAVNEIESAGAFDRMSAEAMISGTFYSVIVADVRLQTEEQGFHLLDDIKRLSPRSRIISITGFATPEMESELRSRGSLMTIRKPAEPGEIIAAVLDLLTEVEGLAASDETLDLEQLHEKVRRVLYSIALRKFRLSVEEAEDVVQEAWLLFLEKRGLIRTAPAWLAGTVLNLCRRHHDRSRRSRERFTEEITMLEGVAYNGETTVANIAVSEALEMLDEKSRKLCTLIAIEGYAYDEASALTGMPLGSVGPTYIRAKKKLRQALEN